MTENRLKFRVYDIRRKIYFNDPVPPLNSDGTLAFQSSHPDFQKYYITEFCTGFSDKNGNLIYEGDIVKAVTNTYKVIWDRYRWAIKDSQGYIFSEYINDLLYDCEIIGNIHEQAEQKE